MYNSLYKCLHFSWFNMKEWKVSLDAKPMSNILRNSQIIFQKGWTISHLTSSVGVFQFLPVLANTRYDHSFYFSKTNRYVVTSHYGFNLNFLND